MSALALARSPQQRHAFRVLLSSEVKLARRRPTGVIVAVGIPLVLLVIFGSIPATTRPTRRWVASRSSTSTSRRCSCSC